VIDIGDLNGDAPSLKAATAAGGAPTHFVGGGGVAKTTGGGGAASAVYGSRLNGACESKSYY